MKPARVGLLLLAIVAIQCGPDHPMRPSPPGPPMGSRNAALIGAGDIGWCGSSGTAQTGRMIARTPGDVFLGGDIAYPQGSSENFMNCFDPFWGHAAGRWLPVPGNHDYDTPGAAGYFDYFGPAAGPRGAGYYQRTLGEWQVLLINSNIAAQAGTPQYEFVRQALAIPERRCQMAIWHHPVFTSGPNGPTTAMRQMYALLNDRGVDVVVNGHEHFYERFSRQDAEGRPTETGLRQFIVGTGGAPLYNFVTVAPNSAVRIASFGIIRFTLRPDAYDWEFEDVDGIIGDTGSTPCH